MDAADDTITLLRGRLERYPVERAPVQHATLALRLGMELAETSPDEAEGVLERAASLFGDRFPMERARCLNALGAARRAAGRPGAAVEVLAVAADLFSSAGDGVEEGAARLNLALSLRESGEQEASMEELAEAERLLGGSPGGRVAARERAAGLLLAGRAEDALEVLAEIDRSLDGDPVEEGAVANLLGLTHLALGDPLAAAAAFRRSAAASPSSLRAEVHAMAKANLALALEQAGDPCRARLAAAQALALEGGGEAVLQQAGGVLTRLGTPVGEMALLMGAGEASPAELRDELSRWTLAGNVVRRAEVAALLTVACRASDPVGLFEAWVSGLLELPPSQLRPLLRALVEASGELEPANSERVRWWVSRAFARFHPPQWARLSALLQEVAGEAGDEARWG